MNATQMHLWRAETVADAVGLGWLEPTETGGWRTAQTLVCEDAPTLAMAQAGRNLGCYLTPFGAERLFVNGPLVAPLDGPYAWLEYDYRPTAADRLYFEYIARAARGEA